MKIAVTIWMTYLQTAKKSHRKGKYPTMDNAKIGIKKENSHENNEEIMWKGKY